MTSSQLSGNCVSSVSCFADQNLNCLDRLWPWWQLQRVCLQALAALFLMNNAHYQLKAVQSNSYLKLISKEWQDDCEAKVRVFMAFHMTNLITSCLTQVFLPCCPRISANLQLCQQTLTPDNIKPIVCYFTASLCKSDMFAGFRCSLLSLSLYSISRYVKVRRLFLCSLRNMAQSISISLGTRSWTSCRKIIE